LVRINLLNIVSIISNTLTNEDIEEQKYIAVSIYKVRDLINEPVNHLNAEDLGNAIYEMCTQVGCEVEVFNKNKIEALKMGGLLAVNQGSVDAPSFTIVEWKPANATNSKPIVLVGKGVVYDSGGLSLKPTSDSMDYMKSDMSGAAVTAGVMYAIAANKIPVYVIGLIPATDNRPSGNAYAPGDVITMMDGTNVEMLNSDAEGRMILADALTYSKRYEPQLTITVATLTGSAAAAIGSYGLVAMGNAPKEIKAKLIESAERTYERMVEFPFWDEYAQDIKSDIAELKNVGGKLGGAITAGKFLEYFAPPSFMHFDIAGVAFSKKNDNYRGKGGTGFGLRLLYDFIKRY
jgi:leucyl aminopeptidase